MDMDNSVVIARRGVRRWEMVLRGINDNGINTIRSKIFFLKKCLALVMSSIGYLLHLIWDEND